ncbi:thiamine-phosphate kinase [Wenzhouxiangella sp. XN79A]|uniref:thiamine-phosphate kinase n=1 Tax=Wenzhouxiangella sp. XN79A TaxID=2724193 RepID=UPI00144AF1AA|nr:thiamine-phosphate kinase [Wenzhouxiangella sp. XN79A]NKI34288.1 thiamine-phosphate kinase [Wenzhouxiangella sp. XN79A]
MNEFDLIERIRARVPERDDVRLGIGDDAAVVQPSRGMQLVATTDQLVEGRHFDQRATPADLGHLALAANLSDLAAMGATPRWLLLALTLPEADPDWLDGFLDGFLALADAYSCVLVGGNLTRGPLNVAITALGEVPAGQFARRRGARPGDRVVVTGWPGDAAAALALNLDRAHPLCDRLLRPRPRIAAGQRLAGLARGLIDISDGLVADLGHALGEFGAELRAEALPASEALRQAVPDDEQRTALQLGGGGDYELLAILPPHTDLPEALDGVPVTVIGRVTESGPIRCLDAAGCDRVPQVRGWDHFADADRGKA